MITQNPESLATQTNDQLKLHLQTAYAELKVVYSALENSRDELSAAVAKAESFKKELQHIGYDIP